MFREYFLLALCLALFSVAQANPTFTGRYAIYNTPGPVLPSFPLDFPFNKLSNNATKAAVVIRRAKLEGFCTKVFLKKDDRKKDDGKKNDGKKNDGKKHDGKKTDGKKNDDDHKIESDNSQLERRQSNYNINSNYNSNHGSGSSYSSSYSNSNGQISQIQSGSPGTNGQTYSYNFVSHEGKPRGPGNSGTSSRSYLINGVKVPEALWGFAPKAIKRGCELAKRRKE